MIPDFRMDYRITQVQNKFQQIKGGHPVKIVLIDQIPVFPVGIDFPTVRLFIIDDFNFTVQIFGNPFFHDTLRQPECAQCKINIFNGKRFRQDFLQGDNIIFQTMQMGIGNLPFDVSGKITAFQHNLFCRRIKEIFFAGK